MGSVQSEKYGLCFKEIEKISLSSERFRTIFNIHRIEKTKLLRDRLNRYDKKKYETKRRKDQRLESFISNLYKTLLTLIKKIYFL